MRVLTESLDGHKEYKNLVTKLENRRLDFDSKLNKVQKSKKENSALEEETRVAQAKYEESLETITQKMLELNNKDEGHHKSLLDFVEDQANFFINCGEIMRELQTQLA